MSNKLARLLRSKWNRIVDRWAERLQRTIGDYGSRPIEELRRTTGSHLDGLIEVLETGSYDKLMSFMHDIATVRIKQGFNLSDIQRAFLIGKGVICDVIENVSIMALS